MALSKCSRAAAKTNLKRIQVGATLVAALRLVVLSEMRILSVLRFHQILRYAQEDTLGLGTRVAKWCVLPPPKTLHRLLNLLLDLIPGNIF